MQFSQRKHGRLAAQLFTLTLISTQAVAIAEPQPDEEALKAMRADCHLEAEAGGLKGNDLDEFVDQCVEELLTVEIHNLKKDL